MAEVSGVTRLADVIVPEVFMRYVIQRTAELSNIRKSGILGTNPNIIITKGGDTIKLPFWNDISGDDEVWSSGHETVPDKITTEKEIAVILTRIKSWGAEDLSGLFAGDDPMAAIGNLVAEYWARKEQRTLLSILDGVFKSAGMAANVLDASAKYLDNGLMVDALAKLGDASTKLTGILAHSAVQFDLAKKKLLDPKPTESGTNTAPEFSSYLGRQVVIDDGAPKNGDVYTTYFFGAGALAFAEGIPQYPVEIERKGTKSLDILINRRQFIMHPRGFKWVGTAADDTPSNTELAVGTNWAKVFENKNIPIVALKHKIGFAPAELPE
ncbi:MAG: major capsid protein [Treponema sp.]|nr:major capsid protein [Treponema sp.]